MKSKIVDTEDEVKRLLVDINPIRVAVDGPFTSPSKVKMLRLLNYLAKKKYLIKVFYPTTRK